MSRVYENGVGLHWDNFIAGLKDTENEKVENFSTKKFSCLFFYYLCYVEAIDINIPRYKIEMLKELIPNIREVHHEIDT